MVGKDQPDGALCTEDGDPCSDDICHEGDCGHSRIDAWDACTPVSDAFREALALAALARGIESTVASVPAVATRPEIGTAVGGMLGPLERAKTDLETAVVALAARDESLPPAVREGATDESPAAARARIAFAAVVGTPRQVRAFLALARGGRMRAALGAPEARGRPPPRLALAPRDKNP